MKKSLKLLIASSALVLAGTLLAGCEEKVPVSQIHEHTFSENWEASDASHWHKATCEHTDVMSNVEDHKFGAWNEEEPAKEAKAGKKSRVCTVCQYKQVAEIAPLAHEHVFDETRFEADDYNHWHKATCHPDIVTGIEAHTYGNWEIETTPTELAKGIEKRECSVCHHVQRQEVDKKLHVHTYSPEWSTNESSHWHAATCEHSDSMDAFGAHQFGEPVIVVSSETEPGSETYTCGVCGYEKVVELPLAEHTHKFANTWTSDALYHWKDATCGHDVIEDKDEHTWGAWDVDDDPTETALGKKSRCCTVCGYVEEAEIPMLPHTHEWSSGDQWGMDATAHWRYATCSCEDSENLRKDVANHDWNTWQTQTPSTCSTQGTMRRVCKVCGYIENDTMPYDTSAHTYATTWTYNDETHWHAATCGHAAKSGEIAHTFNATYGSWNAPIKCTTCDYVKLPAWKNIEQGLPEDYFDVNRTSENVFKFTLHSETQIRLAFSGTASTYANIYVFLIRDDNGQYIMNGTSLSSLGNYSYNGVYQYKQYVSSSTYPAGDYHVVIRSTRSDSFEKGLLITNFSYEYIKGSSNSFNVTIDGQTSTYKINYFSAKYGVNDYYYSIENASGDTVKLFRNASTSKPTVTNNGSFKFTDKQGNITTYYVPNYAYRSADITASPYYIDESTDSYLGIGMNNNQWEIFGKDPYFKGLNGNMSELDAKLVAKYAEYSYYFEDYDFYYDNDLDDIVSIRWGLYCPIGDWNPDFSAYQVDMTFDSSTKNYLYSKESGYDVFAYKITNGQTDDYARFTYKYTTSTSNYDFSGIVLDSNYNQVRLGYSVSNGQWFNPKHNYTELGANADRWAIKPGETYYFLYSNNGKIDIKFERAYYKVILNANNAAVPEDKARFSWTSLYLNQTSSNTTSMYSTASTNTHWDVINLDKEIVGWGSAAGRIDYISTDTFTPTEKKDYELYAYWMNKTDMVYSNQYVGTFSSQPDGITTVQFSRGVTDPNLTVKVGDALNAICKEGANSLTTREIIVTGLTVAGVAVDQIDRASTLNKSTKITFERGSAVVYNKLVALTMKREFSINFDDGYGTDVYDYGYVDKGETFAAPKFADMFDWDYYFDDGSPYEDYYLAGWKASYSDNEIDILDGDDFTPTRNTFFEPVYKARTGSKVVALGHDIEITGEGENARVYFTVLDDDTGFSIDSSTTLTIVCNNGVTYTTSFSNFKLVGSGATRPSVSHADGRVYCNWYQESGVTAEVLASAVMIIVS